MRPKAESREAREERRNIEADKILRGIKIGGDVTLDTRSLYAMLPVGNGAGVDR